MSDQYQYYGKVNTISLCTLQLFDYISYMHIKKYKFIGSNGYSFISSFAFHNNKLYPFRSLLYNQHVLWVKNLCES